MMNTTTILNEHSISWLLSRLTWPSIMARERTCVELGSLLLHPQLGSAVQRNLLKWIEEQRLESIGAIGILPFIRARMQNEMYNMPIAELVEAIHVPSLLAWLLLNELDMKLPLSFIEVCRHSETAPQDFTPNPFFKKYVQNYLPPNYARIVQVIEQHERISLWRQWAFEWQYLLTDLGITPARNDLSRWHRYLPGKEHYVGVDTMLSEVYRSAFLRALAWATEQGVKPDTIQFIAARTCPIDLDLWRVSPCMRPLWWPRTSQSKSQIDTTTVDIWKQVEVLWKQKGMKKDNDSTLVTANGIVHDQETVYNLEIFGIFQSCLGPKVPELADITTWYSGDAADSLVLEVRRVSLLRFGGVVAPEAPETMLQRFADWAVLPAACPITLSNAVLRWQGWRVARGIWLPAPYLANSQISINCEPHAVVLQDSENEIGQWIDWGDGLGETMFEGLPPKSGQVLHVSSQVIEEFAQQTDMTFCWLCQLTRYYQEPQKQAYTSYTEQRVYGASYVYRV